MKTFFLSGIMAATIGFMACSNNDNSNQSTTANKDTTSQAASTNHSTEETMSGTISDVVSGYLSLKNALTNDNANEAASTAKGINESLAKVNESALNADQKKVYDDVKDDIKEHVQHIADNSSKIDHQREHFDLLSRDMIDLVKATGSSQTLYKDFCPMYNNKKGAYWLSETKEIKNPYYGKEMIKCGEIKEEIKAKE